MGAADNLNDAEPAGTVVAGPVVAGPVVAGPVVAGDWSPRVVLLGRQGSGKGTQAERLSALFHVAHISTGDAFRAAVREGSDLGRTAQVYMERGELVPDDVVVGVLREHLVKEAGLGLQPGRGVHPGRLPAQRPPGRGAGGHAWPRGGRRGGQP